MSEWKGWNGGLCPVHPDTIVEVAFSKTGTATSKASAWNWSDKTDPIVAYRVIGVAVPRKVWVKIFPSGDHNIRFEFPGIGMGYTKFTEEV